jgi:hypothetical protein
MSTEKLILSHSQGLDGHVMSWDQEVTIHGGSPVRPSGYERDLKTHHGPPAWSLHNGFLIAESEPVFQVFENPLRKYEEVFRAERSKGYVRIRSV